VVENHFCRLVIPDALFSSLDEGDACVSATYYAETISSKISETDIIASVESSAAASNVACNDVKSVKLVCQVMDRRIDHPGRPHQCGCASPEFTQLIPQKMGSRNGGHCRLEGCLQPHSDVVRCDCNFNSL
jgi:hypothetical protein